MATPKRYFHDKLVLLLLTVNIFMALVVAINVLLRLDFGRSGGYIVQYRASLGLNAFKTGDTNAIAAFAVFAVLITVFHILSSHKIYPVRRFAALMVLFLGLLLSVLSFLVSNALLTT